MVAIAGCGAVLLGMAARDSADLGKPITQDPLTGTLVASMEKTPQEADIPEVPYFESMAELIKEGYVDPLDDEHKLVSGATRGMILSLSDPNSLYMDKDEFRVFQGMRQGSYEGIGAEVVFDFPKTKEDDVNSFPRLRVTVVAPGGPADKAGLKPGDFIESVNKHWIIDPIVITNFRKLAQEVTKDKSKEAEFKKLRGELRTKSETSMMPARARDLLMIGTSGTLNVAWYSDGTLKNADMTRQKSVVKSVDAEGGVIRVHMITGIAGELAKAFPADGNATLDLRNNSSLDLALAREVLALLGPSATYGKMTSNDGSELLKIEKGESKAKKLTLIVDQSTMGAAGIVAKALASKGIATLQGTLPKNLYAAEVVKMPTGDGFTLVRAEYGAAASTSTGKETSK